MLRIVRNVILGVVVVLLLTLAVLFALGYVYQDELKQIAVEQINENINAPIQVKDGIDVTFIRNFPDVSIILNNVVIPDIIQKNKQLLNAKKVSLLFNIYEVFDEKKSVRKIIIENGTIDLYRDKSGKGNYDILKPSSDTAKTLLELKSVVFEDIELSWTDKASKIKATTWVHRLNFSGDFANDSYDLKADAHLNFHHFIYNKDTFNIEKIAELDFKMSIDNQRKIYAISNSTLNVASNKFIVDGKILKDNQNFTIKSSGQQIETLFDLLPEHYKQKLDGISGNGNYEILLAINNSKATSSSVAFNATLQNGELRVPKLSEKVKDVNTVLSYDSKADMIEITQFTASYENKPIRFRLKVNQLSKAPLFILNADGDINLKSMQQFIPEDKVQEIAGNLHFEDFTLLGALDNSNKLISSSIEGSGSFKVNDVVLKANKVTYSNINGQLTYQKGHLIANALTAEFLSSSFYFDGTIDNLFVFIVDRASRSGNTELLVDGTLMIKGFELNKMIAAFKKEQKSDAGKIDIRDVFNMRGNLNLSVDKFQYQKLRFEEINAILALAPGQILLKDFETNTMGGKLRHRGYINFTANQEMEIGGDLSIRDIELTQLFEQSENFYQTTLTDKHIKGKIEADMSFVSFFKQYSEFDPGRLSATLNCKIKNGELINFEPIRMASKFIRIEELNHIYFSDLSNQIIIKDRKISIPQMEVQSSAINLQLNGTHTFDNNIDYHIKVNLRKLLANKFKKDFSNEYIEDDPYEGSNIFLSMSGNVSKPVITYDKQFVKKKIQSDFQSERETLKTIFKKEVEKPIKEDVKEDKFFDTREKPQFIEFDDN